ncbi:carbon-nitrogen hydrolase family protein [Pokkaliibacter plantistimulans]|uniref:Carbon-nitrogen hydrolase family protein n=1 Tax=Proteobacteria bacterium 228 TaxID=2083153 RepID=A0A2S5KS48_9PROT|nr:carbon-nitrogen hydrolase family protein [Pokkaliibacter plantistimulans]PPC77543.1 carbon-nitrogen hydrolase family protein [Pokkaliibacter plantistimulans]
MAEQGCLRMLACQIEIPSMRTAAERDAHLARVEARVREQLQAQPVDLVVLPELASIEYSREAFECLNALAEPLDGASYQCWSRVAREFGVYVAYGFARREADSYFISIGVVDPQGRQLGYYDKLHLAQYGASMEKEFFSRGDHLCVFEVNGFRLAPIICYDIRIPELSRTLVVDHGVDVILHCGAYYRDCSFHTWHDFLLTRALENQCYLLSLNQAGPHYGNSLFCHPWHDESLAPTAFPEHDEGFRVLKVQRQELQEVRENFSFLRDRLSSYDLPVHG